jgi:xylulokinase
MNKLIGMDIGTSSLKAVVTNHQLEVLCAKQVDYETMHPYPGWAEQDPHNWWEAVRWSLQSLELEGEQVSIGLSGQMHGLVALDSYGQPVRPAMIWADQRSSPLLEKVELENSFNLWPGTLLASLLWVKENEPGVYRKIDRVMLPKDYIRYKLTGRIGTDHSDACGTGAYRLASQNWDWELLEKLGLDSRMFPPIQRSTDIAGTLLPEVASELSIAKESKVAYGGSDHSMQLLGNGIFAPRLLNCNIGTGSQISVTVDTSFPLSAEKAGPSIFLHSVGGLANLVGTSLNGGSVLQWLKGLIAGGKSAYAEFDRLAAGVAIGCDGLVFLPYLNGERHLPKANGVMHGLTAHHSAAHLVRAGMEGMVYALRDVLEVMRSSGVVFDRVIASGGGAKSQVLLQMQADVFDCHIWICEIEEQAAMGAAIMAGLSTGVIASLEEVADCLQPKMKLVARPICENVLAHDKGYQRFKQNFHQHFKEDVK